jgi:hypothetical protein
MFKKLILVGFVFLFLGFKLVLATEGIPTISYTFNGTSSDIVVNPVVNPVEIKFSASENIPNWVSIKIQKTDDSSIYKTFSPNSCDGIAYCTETWNGAISPKNKVLVDGVYNIFVHIKKDVASPVIYDFILTSPYTITVDSSILTSSETLTPNVIPVSEPTTTETKTKIVEVQKIKTKIIGKALGFAGIPLSFDASVLGADGEPLRYGKYFWNFGDGDAKEVLVNNSGKFSHTFFYPGDYAVSLFYYSNYYSDVPDASDQITVKIVSADVSISRVGEEKDFFVELSNNTDYGVDLSNWLLVSEGKNFTIPRNTILSPKNKIIISPKISNFSFADKDTLKLINSEREVVFDYKASLIPSPLIKGGSEGGSLDATPPNPPLSKERVQTVIPADDLPATVLQSSPESISSNSYLPIFSSIVFIGAGAGSVYLIRRRKVIPNEAKDFEILEG